MICNDPDPILQAVLGGEGIAFLPNLFIGEPMRQGLLLHVLPEWTGAAIPVSAVYPSRRGLSPKVRVFVDFLGEQMGMLGSLHPGETRPADLAAASPSSTALLPA